MTQRHDGPEGDPRPFRYRSTSPVSATLLASGVLLAAVSALGAMPGFLRFDGSAASGAILGLLPDGEPLWAGIALIALSAASEAVSRLRVPPPAWRVRQELGKCLIDLGLLPEDKREWKGVYWVAPIGRYDRRTGAYSLLFDVRNVRANEARLRKLEDGMAGFAYSQSVSVEPASFKDRRECMRLVVHYARDPYGKMLERERPW